MRLGSTMTTDRSGVCVAVDRATVELLLQLVAGAYASPRDALAADLASGTFGAVVQDVADGLGVDAPDLGQPQVATLQSCYVDLFVSSARGLSSPPYVGYAVDDELLGPTAVELGRFLEGHGIGTDPGWTDLPDHLAAVAEAAGLLARDGHDEAARYVLTHFLCPWFDRYAAHVASKDVSGFYGPLTRFLHASIREVRRGNRS